jgi:endonuclease-3 related protein
MLRLPFSALRILKRLQHNSIFFDFVFRLQFTMSVVREIYEVLCEHYDSRPLESGWLGNPVEVVIGSVLAQGTTWRVVLKVLELLRARSLLNFRAIVEADGVLLSDLIRTVSFHVKKTQRLKDIAQLFLSYGNGNINNFFARDIDLIRKELLRVQGVNPSTVDNIILYAGKLPIYVVDIYTARIFRRHGIVHRGASDADIQQFMHFELVPDEQPCGAELFSVFQTLMVKIGRTFCNISQPNCVRCPLSVLLPESGVCDIEIQDESTIQIIPVILANRLRLKPNRPKIPALSPTQLKPIISEAKQQQQPKTKNQITQTPPKPKSKTKQKIATNTQHKKDQTQQPPQPQQQNKQLDKELNLSDVEKSIVDKIGFEPVQIDQVVQATQLPVHIVRANIAILEMRKILRQVEGNRVERNPEL